MLFQKYFNSIGNLFLKKNHVFYSLETKINRYSMLDPKSVYWTNRNTAQEHSDYIMSKKEQTLEIKGQFFSFYS